MCYPNQNYENSVLKGFATCSIDKKYRKVLRYFWYRDTKKYRGIRDTSIVKFWYRDISKYRQYRPALILTDFHFLSLLQSPGNLQ